MLDIKKIIFILSLTFQCISQEILAQDGVTISVTEQTLNDLFDIANRSELLSYSVWDRGDFTKRLDNCDGQEEFEEHQFYHLSLPNTISIDVQNGNRFTLSSSLKHSNGEDIFLQGFGSFESPVALFGAHVVQVSVTAFGSVGGYFTFNNNKLKLIFDNVDLRSFVVTDNGGTRCGASWGLALFIINTLQELEVNIGSAILPNALKGYFKPNAPTITTTSNSLNVTYETIPFSENDLDGNYSATAAHRIDLDGLTVPSTAASANITAGNVIVLRNFTVEQGASFHAKIQPHNFGTEVID